jgi:hypothetical protein
MPYLPGDFGWNHAKYEGSNQAKIDRVLYNPNQICPSRALSEQLRYDISSLLTKNFPALENILAQAEPGEQFLTSNIWLQIEYKSKL